MWLVRLSFVALGLVVLETSAHAAPAYELRRCVPNPLAACHPRWMFWNNATFQFPASPNNPEINVAIQGRGQIPEVEKITVTMESMTYEVRDTELRHLSPAAISSISVDLSADRNGDPSITLQIFHDSTPTEFKVMELQIYNMQMHVIGIREVRLPMR